MNGNGIVYRPALGRLALILAGILTAFGLSVAPAQAQAGYEVGYYNPNPCSYRCGYPAYRYYPAYRRHYGCYSCRPHLVYERRYVEREYVERRYGYGYGGYRRPYGQYYPYGYRRNYGYAPYGYRSQPLGYGYAGIGRRWPAPYLAGYGQDGGGYGGGYEEPPRPPAPIMEPGDE